MKDFIRIKIVPVLIGQMFTSGVENHYKIIRDGIPPDYVIVDAGYEDCSEVFYLIYGKKGVKFNKDSAIEDISPVCKTIKQDATQDVEEGRCPECGGRLQYRYFTNPCGEFGYEEIACAEACEACSYFLDYFDEKK